MKKPIFFGVLLLGGVVFVGCKKDVALNPSKGFPSESEIIRSLEAELDAIHHAQETFRSSVNYKNNLNAFDNVGEEHNEILRYINGNFGFDDFIDICRVIDQTKREFAYAGDFSCEYFQNSVGEGLPLLFDQNGNYSKALFDKLVADGKITSLERAIMHSTLTKTQNMPTPAKAYQGIKVSEHTIMVNPQLSADQKRRMLTALSILRHSIYYWAEEAEIVEFASPCGWLSSYADAAAEYFAKNYDGLNDPFQDGASINMFSSTVSTLANSLCTAIYG